jgi:tetraprenyl-beta-curcumene synthase
VRASTCHRAALARGFALPAARYWLAVYPQVRRELADWRDRARLIADPELRRLALKTQRAKRGNLEGAAAFATFAPVARRAAIVRASIAFQALYDFADTLTEQPPNPDPGRARRLHSDLLAALPSGEGQCADRRGGRRGYMASLVGACRGALAELPSFPAVYELVEVNTRRIVQYQTLIDRPAAFAAWAAGETPAGSGLRWWETGAACGSSTAIFALIAAAGTPGLRPEEATAIERAYFPWIGALHTLLDSLIDQPDDLAGEQHSLIEHYRSSTVAAGRMGHIATEATRLAHALPGSTGHGLILAGMTSQYASSPRAFLPHARAARAAVLDAMGDLAAPTLAVFAARRLLAKSTDA